MGKKLVLLVLAAAALIGIYLWVARDGGPPPPKPPLPEVAGTKTPSTAATRVGGAQVDPTARPPKPSVVVVDAGVAPPPNTPPPPIDDRSPLKGIQAREFTEADRERLGLPAEVKTGLMLLDVDPTSPGAEARLNTDDVIVRAHKTNVTSLDDLARAVGDRDATILRVYRKGRPFEIVIQKPFIKEKK